MNVLLAGTGCGDPESMTVEVRSAIGQADILIGAKRLLESITDEMTTKKDPQKKAAVYAGDILEIIKNEIVSGAEEKTVCVLFSGDAGFYSGAKSLAPLLDEAGIDCKVLPGISSVQMFSARLKRPWQDWLLVSAHGADCDAVSQVCKGRPVFFLTGGRLGPADLCKQLDEAGLGMLQVTVGERLSYRDERIVSGTAAEFAGQDFAPLSVMLTEPAPTVGDLTPGIPDETFVRGKVPMTKRDVRAAILSRMKIESDNLVWDVGSGTGSVTIELAMKASAGKVYAVERNPEGIGLLAENRRKFGVWNIISKEGSAPEALRDLPAPDRVFIGGSGGDLRQIIDLILDKNGQARICVAAIVLETLQEAILRMTARGLDTEIVQIAANKARQVGSGYMMLAENPVYIVTGQRAETGGYND